MPSLFVELSPPVLWTLAGILGALAIGTCVRLGLLRGMSRETATARKKSLVTWWILVLIFSSAVLLGELGIVVLLFAASFLGLSEYLRLVFPGRPNRWRIYVPFVLLLLSYLWLLLGMRTLFLLFVPLCCALDILVRRTLFTSRGSWSVTLLDWPFGLLLTGWFLPHTLPLPPPAGPEGWPDAGRTFFLALMLLTEINDISQALVGRGVGKRRIAPRLSPNKTWEGFIGGLSVTVLSATFLLPLLTPLRDLWGIPFLASGLAGLLIAVSGFFGDLSVSAVKRSAGVKDSGHLLPGQGGILDRIDSATLAAPVFYYYCAWVH